MHSSTKETFERDGYVVVHGLISPEQMMSLRDASERITAATRAGDWPYRRVVGKQFPPFDDANPDSWGVQHIMHPDLHEPEFVKWYTSDALVNTVTQLLGCDEHDLQMGQ
jgi:hypothetical protein